MKRGLHIAGIVFDTYGAIKRLVSKGIREDQAEELVNVISEIKYKGLNNLATKEQVLAVQHEVEDIIHQFATKADLEKVNGGLTAEIEKVRTEMQKGQKWILFCIGSTGVAICGFIAWLLNYFRF
jgi:hypothetical protein